MTHSAAPRPSTPEQAKEMGLLPGEFERITEILGRTPNFTELCIYSVMWSEERSLKTSRRWLGGLYGNGRQPDAGGEGKRAGVIDLGDGLECVFRLEAHRPLSGGEAGADRTAGAGSFSRDLLTMGALPAALLNTIHLGPLEEGRTRAMLSAVVKEAGEYSHALDVQATGGTVFFDEGYLDNPVLNTLSVGLLDTSAVISSRAQGIGNPVYIAGALTGTEGAQRAGDPFQEKLLLEAAMELAQTGAIEGMRDISNGGLCCAVPEMCAAGLTGMDIHLDLVPLSKPDMEPFEIVLSETKGRLLFAARSGHEEAVAEVFAKWGLSAVKIGEVTGNPVARYLVNGEQAAGLPTESLLPGGTPVYEEELGKPEHTAESSAFSIDRIAEPKDLVVVARQLLANPNIAGRRWLNAQYLPEKITEPEPEPESDLESDPESEEQNGTDIQPTDAAVVRIGETGKALVMAVGCNPRYAEADPEIGAMIAVAEAARSISCTGGVPAAATIRFNAGDPLHPDVHRQLAGSARGIGAVCRSLEIPVADIGVNYCSRTIPAEGNKQKVMPAPVVGMIGVMKDSSLLTAMDFKYKGDLIYLLGESRNEISSSEYLASFHGVRNSPPPWFDPEQEVSLQLCVRGLIANNYISSAHDVGAGGLFITLAEMAMPDELGFDIVTDSEIRRDAFLFGESQSRVVVTVVEDYEEEFLDFVGEAGVQVVLLGHVTKGRITVDDINFGAIGDLRKIYDGAIEEEMTP
jgi:phosphoribosylformylglycinamidine synthase subunit PurL